MPTRRLIVAVVAIGVLAAACSSDGSAGASEEAVTDETPAAGVDEPPSATEAPTTSESGTQGGNLVAQDGDVVDVHYVGTLDDGSQFDSSRERGEPLQFTVGAGQLLPGFDEAVRSAQVGDVTTVRLEASEAYGEWSEENVIEVPFNPEQGDIAVGDEVYLTNGIPAVILEITDETVTLDANHRLAGEALTFEIEVLAITRG